MSTTPVRSAIGACTLVVAVGAAFLLPVTTPSAVASPSTKTLDAAASVAPVHLVTAVAGTDFAWRGAAPQGSIIRASYGGKALPVFQTTGPQFTLTLPAAALGTTLEITAEHGGQQSAPLVQQFTGVAADGSVPPPQPSAFVEHPDTTQSFTPRVTGTESQRVWLLNPSNVVVHSAVVAPGVEGPEWTIPPRFLTDFRLVAFSMDGLRQSVDVDIPNPLTIAGVSSADAVYTPGETEFSGTANPGATIAARDQNGTLLFSTTARASRSAAAQWSASASLPGTDGYVVTFTQQLPSGLTTTMPDIRYSPAPAGTIPAPTVSGVTLTEPRSARFGWHGSTVPNARVTAVFPSGGRQTATSDGTGSFTLPVEMHELVETAAVTVQRGTDTSTALTARPDAGFQDDSLAAPNGTVVHERIDGSRSIEPVPDADWAHWMIVTNGAGRAVWADLVDPTDENVTKLVTIPSSERGTHRVFMMSDGLDRISAPVVVPDRLVVADVGEENTYVPGPQHFSGTAASGAVVSATDQDGRLLFRTTSSRARSGAWEATAELPAGGDHSVTFAQTAPNGVRSVLETVHFTAEPAESAPITISGPTTAYTGVSNRFRGTGEPGASFRVVNASGTVIVPGEHVVQADGTWSFDRVVSTGATSFRFAIEQSAGGSTTTSKLFTVGAEPSPITVTTREARAGEENRFSGTAPAGSTFRVLNPGGTQIVEGTHRVAADGTWSFDRVVSRTADRFDFVLEVTIDDDRLLTGTNRIAVTAGHPVTVRTASVAPGKLNTFTGTGPAGADYRVRNASGTQIVPGEHRIGADGAWSFDRIVSTGATNFRFTLEVTKDGVTRTSQLFTVPAE
ncbi:hypothetical protein [Curtobacterium pusillum]|uniref:hypothetical protein n=1 Tax=Curtobacterium pusillum TaxID=69373 RepID=UPI0011A37FA1|nr:hypothetical protein [Curtobacterium pusillum]